MPKRKPAAAAAPKRKQKKDWRTPLFYWRGGIAGTTWEGTWVANDAGLPSDAEFEASPNTFKLECSRPLARLYEGVDGHRGAEATLTGSYKLDNGDGPADYSDTRQTISAWNGPPDHHPSPSSWAVVGARGDTEFGRFVSLGRLDQKAAGEVPGNDTYQRLTLVRRYIEDDDPRTSMDAKDVCRRVGSCGPDEGFIDVPWLALPWKVPRDWPAPLPVDACTMALLEANCEEEETGWMVGVGPKS